MKNTHYKTQKKRGFLKQTFTYEEQKRNGFCRFWNNSECFYGNQCKFLHEEAPYCRFQEQCSEKQGPHPINPLLIRLILFWGFLQAKPGGKEDSTTNIINFPKIQIQSTKGEEKVKNKVN